MQHRSWTGRFGSVLYVNVMAGDNYGLAQVQFVSGHRTRSYTKRDKRLRHLARADDVTWDEAWRIIAQCLSKGEKATLKRAGFRSTPL